MTRQILKLSFCWFILVSLSSCGTYYRAYYSEEGKDWMSKKPTKENRPIHSLYLIGDAGELDDTITNKNYVLDAAGNLISKETIETSLVFLGDNVYPHGLQELDDPKRNMGERIMDAQLDMAGLHDGVTYCIPGNHDWNKHKKGGREAILRQEAYVHNHPLADRIKFYPKQACGDPELVTIGTDLVYVFLDTQWWLQDWTREAGINDNCEVKSLEDLLTRMEEIFKTYQNKELIVMLHHPIKSNGNHGGNFSLKNHVFPLTDLNPKLWVPFPFIGSLYPLYRGVTGSKQDITNNHNAKLMQALDRMAKENNGRVIFASGHEHGMQYYDGDKVKYVVSGGGSRSGFIQKWGEAVYAREARGFARINFYADNESWLEIYTTKGFDQEPVLEYRTQLRGIKKEE